MARKPRIFIGSSVESLHIADAININLDHEFEVTIWKNGTFELSSNTIDSLIKKANSVDFAAFIFSPDDLSIIREQKKKTVRDNVVFELGLFIGSLGKERCFIIKPRGEELHLPSDLLGVTCADYEPNRSDGDLNSAINYPSSQMKTSMQKLGTLNELGTSGNIVKPQKIQPSEINISKTEHSILTMVIKSATSEAGGFSAWQINEAFKELSRIDLGLIKLERLQLIEKVVETSFDYNQESEYYVYKITNQGIEYVLEHETEVYSIKSSSVSKSLDFDEDTAGDDLPF